MTDQNEKMYTKDEVDEIVRSRITRERERLEKSGEIEELREQIAAKDEELEDLRSQHRTEAAERLVRDHLSGMGIDEGKISRIMRHVDLSEVDTDNPKLGAVSTLNEVKKDFPELFEGKRVIGSGSGGSDKPVLEPEKPLTREEIENMSVEEQRKPGMKERIDTFLRGER